MIFDYSYKPDQKDIVVSLLIDGCEDIYPDFETQLKTYTQNFGVTYLPLIEQHAPKYQYSLFRHLLVLVKTDDVEAAIQRCHQTYPNYNCISIGMVYSTENAMHQAKGTIDRLKQQYGDSVNFLRPDICQSEQWFCSDLKLLDNAICDTIRIKYHPQKMTEKPLGISEEARNYFDSMSKLYTKYHLYHRSASDGFFALRYKDGILITATKTYKNPLDCERISFIQDYDEKTNVLTYSGQYLPSSDSVEAWVVFKENPDITSIVHTHASERFTRNPKYQHKVVVPKGTYGDPNIGHQINQQVKKYTNDFLILEEHGEYFSFTQEPLQVSNTLENILKSETTLI